MKKGTLLLKSIDCTHSKSNDKSMKLALLFDSALIITSVALMPGISHPQTATNNNYMDVAGAISDCKINISNYDNTLSSNFTNVTDFKPFDLQSRSLSRDFSN
ncbi:hypothetical protein GS682_05105 [Nostoc sp. B(2019)]|nr:hypothetical protein [Nostoc sp. B(2019)]